MKQRNMTIAALACGALCAVCIAGFLASVQGRANAERAEVLARYGGEQVEVCVATRDIAQGERVDASAVETRLWVSDLLPEGAVREASDAVGKTATTSILKGEVVVSKRFENGRGALDVPQGKEAVSVPAKAVQAVGGAIRSGMSVDVYAAGDSATNAIVKDVVVLDTSVGGSSIVSSDSGWITLAVDPERVQEIIAAANKTSLYFVVPGEQLDGGNSVESASATDGGMAGPNGSASSASNPPASSAAPAVAGGQEGTSSQQAIPSEDAESSEADGGEE